MLPGVRKGAPYRILKPLIICVLGSLDANELCGVDMYGEGTYTAEGITAIADALRVNAELTKIW